MILKKLCSILLALFLVVCTSPIVFAEEVVEDNTAAPSETEMMIEEESEEEVEVAPEEQPQVIEQKEEEKEVESQVKEEEKVETSTDKETTKIEKKQEEKIQNSSEEQEEIIPETTTIEMAPLQKMMMKSAKNAAEPTATVRVYVNNNLKNTYNLPISYGSIDIWQYNNAYGELPTNGGSATINGKAGIFLFYGGDNCTIFKAGFGMVEDDDEVVVNLYYQTKEEETIDYGTIELKFKPENVGHQITFYGEKGAEYQEITLSVDENGILKGDSFDLSYTWTFQAGNLEYVLDKDDFIDNYWSTDASLEEYTEPTPETPDGLDHTLTIWIEFNREPGGDLVDLSSNTKFDSLEKDIIKKGGDTITWNELVGSFSEIEIFDSTIIYNDEEFRDSSLGMTGPDCTTGTLVHRGETIMPNGDAKISLQFIYIEPQVKPSPDPDPTSDPDPVIPDPDPEPTPNPTSDPDPVIPDPDPINPDPQPEPTPDSVIPTPTPNPITPMPKPVTIITSTDEGGGGDGEDYEVITVAAATTLATTTTPTAEETKEPLTAEVEEIDDIRIPLAKTEETWALVNLIAMVITVTVSLILTILGWYNRWRRRNIELDEDENEKYQFWLRNKILFRIINSALAIISIITFILTENIFLRLVFVDRFTPLMIAFAILAIGAALFSKYVIKEYYPQTQDEEDDDEDEE